MGMHAAVGQEAAEVQPSSCSGHGVKEPVQDRIRGKGAIRNGLVDAREVLVHDPACADVQMADLGVAHLAFGQTDRAVVGRDPCGRKLAAQLIQSGRFRQKRSVARAIRRKAPAVHNDQENR